MFQAKIIKILFFHHNFNILIPSSVNSYILKYSLANGLKDIILVDYDKFTKDNAFRFAFPYKGKKKIYAVKEFCKNLDEIKIPILLHTDINVHHLPHNPV